MKIIIDRFNDKEKYEQSYDIDDKDIQGKTLLSFAFYQKKQKDITLNFTVSCQSAICGACAVRVNGILILLVILKCKIC